MSCYVTNEVKTNEVNISRANIDSSDRSASGRLGHFFNEFLPHAFSVSNVVSVPRWSPAVQSDRLGLIVHTLALGDDLEIWLCTSPSRLNRFLAS